MKPTIFPTTITSTCTGYEADSAGLITYAECTGTPPTTANVFQIGCKMVQTDAVSGSPSIFTNTGTSAIPVFENGGGSVSVSLTASQLQTMYTTPVNIVPAITGKAIIIDSMELDITRTSTAFTGGGVVAVQYDSTANGAGTATTATIAATVVTGSAGRTITNRIPVNLSDVASAAIVGIGLYISNQTAVFAAGTGTAIVKVKYHTV